MESFFSTLNTERCARTGYRTREQVKANVFNCIERLYNPLRTHSKLNSLRQGQFEERQRLKSQAKHPGNWGKLTMVQPQTVGALGATGLCALCQYNRARSIKT